MNKFKFFSILGARVREWHDIITGRAGCNASNISQEPDPSGNTLWAFTAEIPDKDMPDLIGLWQDGWSRRIAFRTL